MDDILPLILSKLNVSDVLNYRVTNHCNNVVVCTKLSKKYIIKLKPGNIDKISELNNGFGIRNLYYDLDLSYNIKISDGHLKHLTNLTSLTLQYNKNITDESLKCLVDLTSLNLFENREITDESLKLLINLTSLNLTWNNKITYSCIVYLQKRKCIISKQY